MTKIWVPIDGKDIKIGDILTNKHWGDPDRAIFAKLALKVYNISNNMIHWEGGYYNSLFIDTTLSWRDNYNNGWMKLEEAKPYDPSQEPYDEDDI